ncbi:MAG: hypothetical protein R2912_01180 [Eubacteriales bacterium]
MGLLEKLDKKTPAAAAAAAAAVEADESALLRDRVHIPGCRSAQ